MLGLAAAANGESAVEGQRTSAITAEHVRHVLRSGWSMIEASVTPLAVLLICRLLGASAAAAVTIALWYAVALLIALGWLAATRAGLTRWLRLAATMFAAVLGLLVVALKASLH